MHFQQMEIYKKVIFLIKIYIFKSIHRCHAIPCWIPIIAWHDTCWLAQTGMVQCLEPWDLSTYFVKQYLLIPSDPFFNFLHLGSNGKYYETKRYMVGSEIIRVNHVSRCPPSKEKYLLFQELECLSIPCWVMILAWYNACSLAKTSMGQYLKTLGFINLFC